MDDATPVSDAMRVADAAVDATPDAEVDASVDATPDAMVDAGVPDAYIAPHPIGELGAGLSTLVGFSGPGLFDGPRDESLFRNPVNVLVGPGGDIYVADFGNDAIRVVTAQGVTTALTRQVGFFRPFGMAFTPNGDFYVQTDRSSADQNTGALWKIALDTGIPTLARDDVGRVRGLASLSDGRLVMADSLAHIISVYDPVQETVTTIAGLANTPGFVNGSGADARFNVPVDLVVTSTDDIFVADSMNHRIRYVTLGGTVVTLAGNGLASSVDGNALIASFNRPTGLALESDIVLYITEFSSGLIRKLQLGAISTIAGTSQGFADNIDPLLAQLYVCEGIDFALPYLYIADGSGGTEDLFNRVRRMQVADL